MKNICLTKKLQTMKQRRSIVGVFTLVCLLISSGCATTKKPYSPYKKRIQHNAKKCNCPVYGFSDYKNTNTKKA